MPIAGKRGPVCGEDYLRGNQSDTIPEGEQVWGAGAQVLSWGMWPWMRLGCAESVALLVCSANSSARGPLAESPALLTPITPSSPAVRADKSTGAMPTP